MPIIKLGNGGYTLVSYNDYNLYKNFPWQLTSSGYACYYKYVRGSGRKNQKQIYFRLHRLILNAPNNLRVDHINGNKLDNRRENLRLCSSTENQRNRTKSLNKSSIYKGVSWSKKYKKWESHLVINYKSYFLGYFQSELHAAMCYDLWAKDKFGEFAKLNFVFRTNCQIK